PSAGLKADSAFSKRAFPTEHQGQAISDQISTRIGQTLSTSHGRTETPSVVRVNVPSVRFIPGAVSRAPCRYGPPQSEVVVVRGGRVQRVGAPAVAGVEAPGAVVADVHVEHGAAVAVRAPLLGAGAVQGGADAAPPQVRFDVELEQLHGVRRAAVRDAEGGDAGQVPV